MIHIVFCERAGVVKNSNDFQPIVKSKYRKHALFPPTNWCLPPIYVQQQISKALKVSFVAFLALHDSCSYLVKDKCML